MLAYAVAKDVKPENIMISGEKPEITLVDFGLAMDAGKEVEEGVTKPTSSAHWASTWCNLWVRLLSLQQCSFLTFDNSRKPSCECSGEDEGTPVYLAPEVRISA